MTQTNTPEDPVPAIVDSHWKTEELAEYALAAKNRHDGSPAWARPGIFPSWEAAFAYRDGLLDLDRGNRGRLRREAARLIVGAGYDLAALPLGIDDLIHTAPSDGRPCQFRWGGRGCMGTNHGPSPAVHMLTYSLPAGKAGTHLCAGHSPHTVSEHNPGPIKVADLF